MLKSMIWKCLDWPTNKISVNRLPILHMIPKCICYFHRLFLGGIFNFDWGFWICKDSRLEISNVFCYLFVIFALIMVQMVHCLGCLNLTLYMFWERKALKLQNLCCLLTQYKYKSVQSMFGMIGNFYKLLFNPVILKQSETAYTLLKPKCHIWQLKKVCFMMKLLQDLKIVQFLPSIFIMSYTLKFNRAGPNLKHAFDWLINCTKLGCPTIMTTFTEY